MTLKPKKFLGAPRHVVSNNKRRPPTKEVLSGQVPLNVVPNNKRRPPQKRGPLRPDPLNGKRRLF